MTFFSNDCTILNNELIYMIEKNNSSAMPTYEIILFVEIVDMLKKSGFSFTQKPDCLGPSMEPTIYSENVVVTEHLSVNHYKVNRGDIVISKSPSNPKHYICKRVKAIPGDKIHVGLFSEIVPKGHVWLEGDNKGNSSDSRSYGPVPQGLIRGRVILIIWPFTNIRKLTTFAEPST